MYIIRYYNQVIRSNLNTWLLNWWTHNTWDACMCWYRTRFPTIHTTMHDLWVHCTCKLAVCLMHGDHAHIYMYTCQYTDLYILRCCVYIRLCSARKWHLLHVLWFPVGYDITFLAYICLFSIHVVNDAKCMII